MVDVRVTYIISAQERRFLDNVDMGVSNPKRLITVLTVCSNEGFSNVVVKPKTLISFAKSFTLDEEAYPNAYYPERPKRGKGCVFASGRGRSRDQDIGRCLVPEDRFSNPVII